MRCLLILLLLLSFAIPIHALDASAFQALETLRQSEADDEVPAQEAVNDAITQKDAQALAVAKARVETAQQAMDRNNWFLRELSADCPARDARIAQGMTLLKAKLQASLDQADADAAKRKQDLQDALKALP